MNLNKKLYYSFLMVESKNHKIGSLQTNCILKCTHSLKLYIIK